MKIMNIFNQLERFNPNTKKRKEKLDKPRLTVEHIRGVQPDLRDNN